MKKPYIPDGCDQQGRYPEAAEAATDLGADEPPDPDHVRVVLIDCLIACAIVGTIAVILWRLVG